MGMIEEFDDDAGLCPMCQKPAETKCTACKAVFYCSKGCQKKHWKEHKFECMKLPYKVNSYIFFYWFETYLSYVLFAKNCYRSNRTPSWESTWWRVGT